MEYEFDPAKAKSNFRKHGIAFSDVERFDWDSAIVIRDDREDYGEDRFRALGFIDETLCAMVFTEREELVRVISLRRASRQERVSYDRQAE
ncbi:MAG: BrnT family toxin [Rhodospirillaceae bacterium]|jgi:hypothetical protein|nr:BrnT family toxin [Rhodospirillaceae bacterium]MBT5457860.1 BrnT family toxin [Rhodospirillaceae bacterium]